MTVGAQVPRTGFAGKRGLVWSLIASWLVPSIMTGAYIFLMATSETDTDGKVWEGVGWTFVLTLWFMFRMLTAHAALARAVAVGDAERVLELADRRLAQRGPKRSRLYHAYRALGHDIRGDWSAALADLDRAPSHGTWRMIAATVRVGALVETGRVAEARVVFDAELGPTRPRDAQSDIRARLAEARLRWAEKDLDGAERLLGRLTDDVRAGSGIRATAHFYAARCAEARGDTAAATRHRAKARELAPGSWVAR